MIKTDTENSFSLFSVFEFSCLVNGVSVDATFGKGNGFTFTFGASSSNIVGAYIGLTFFVCYYLFTKNYVLKQKDNTIIIQINKKEDSDKIYRKINELLKNSFKKLEKFLDLSKILFYNIYTTI